MQGSYRGFELRVRQEKSLVGDDRVFTSAIRSDDGWILVEEPLYPSPDMSVNDYMADLKVTVDTYWSNPEEYDDDE